MSHRTRLLVATAAVGLVMVMFLVVALLDAGLSGPVQFNGETDSQTTFERHTPPSQYPLPEPRSLGHATKEIMVPDATFEQRLEQQYASYDRIVVEVHTDGSLSVLGRLMPMDGLRSLLGTQQMEGVKTLVTIQPENDCVYRHIDHIIRLCHDLGVPHKIVSAPASSATKTEPLLPDVG